MQLIHTLRAHFSRTALIIVLLVSVISPIGATFLTSESAAALTADEMKQCYDGLNNKTFMVSNKTGKLDPPLSKSVSDLYYKCTSSSDPIKNCLVSQTLKAPIGITYKYTCTLSVANAVDSGLAYAKSKFTSALQTTLCNKGQTDSSISQCQSKLASEFSSCFDGYVQNNEDFVYPTFDLNFIAQCTADHTGYQKAAILTALKSASADVQAKIGEYTDTIPKNTGDKESRANCEIDGVGWIVCPVATFISTLNDSMFGIIKTFLEIDTGMFSTNPSKGTNAQTYKVWQNVRNIANALFIIVFLIIIYSQMIGGGRR